MIRAMKPFAVPARTGIHFGEAPLLQRKKLKQKRQIPAFAGR